MEAPVRFSLKAELMRRRAHELIPGGSHTDAEGDDQFPDIDRTIEAVEAACRVYRRALDSDVHGHLEGRPVKPVFRRFA
jgi:hypothetical protein